MVSSSDCCDIEPRGTASENPATHEYPALRQLLFGNKPHIYRVIYSVDEAANRVDIFTFGTTPEDRSISKQKIDPVASNR